MYKDKKRGAEICTDHILRLWRAYGIVSLHTEDELVGYWQEIMTVLPKMFHYWQGYDWQTKKEYKILNI